MQLLHNSREKGGRALGVVHGAGGDANGSQRSHWDAPITQLSPGATRGVAWAAPHSCPRQDLTYTTSLSVPVPPARSCSNVLPAQKPNWSCSLLPCTGTSIHPRTFPISICLSGQQSGPCHCDHQPYIRLLYEELCTVNNLYVGALFILVAVYLH